jgi:VWFA-related protein
MWVMVSVRRVVSIAALVALIALAGLAVRAQQTKPDAQQPADPPPAQTAQAPVFRTGINFVRVDVIVSDKSGNNVADLKATDFNVTEDGKPQTIETFKLIKLDGGAVPSPEGPPRQILNDSDEELEAARDDVRLFAIFLDDYHVGRNNSVTVRKPLTQFIETQLGPSDMLGVMYPLQPVSAVRMSRNHEAIVKGLQTFDGRKGDYTPRNQIEEQYAHLPAQTVEDIRNQVSLSAIEGLIVHMGSLKQGRKALILVSEGYSSILPPQLRDAVAGVKGLGNPAAFDPLAGANDPNEDRAQAFANFDMQDRLRVLYDAANKNNVAIYAVDPRGLAAAGFGIEDNIGAQVDSTYLRNSIDTLRTLSEQTDGRAIVNRNDIAGGMRQIVRDTSAYYLLGYNSTQAPSDGKFHEVKVRVNRSGVQVRARKGYWALTADDTKRALAPPKPGPPKAVEAALAAVSTPSRSRVIRTWIGTSRGENGKTRITFVWEPAPHVPGEREAASEMPSRVTLTAAADDGSPYFRGRLPDAASATATAKPGTAPGAGAQRITFEAKPGRLQLKVSVEGASSQVLDSETREIAVPDLTAPQTLFGTPEIFRARTVREYQQIKVDADAVPTALREFIRSDRLLVRVPAYAPGSTTPTLSVHLLNRASQPMFEMPVSPGSAPGTQQFDVPLASLPPGEYLLEIKPQGSDSPKELVGFRITG